MAAKPPVYDRVFSAQAGAQPAIGDTQLAIKERIWNENQWLNIGAGSIPS